MKTRRSGILLHITSLPSAYGIGDLGPEAFRFADFLVQGGQSLWQVLPLGPSIPFCGNSPYAATSAFAGNPLLISPEVLVKDGWLTAGELSDCPVFPEDRVDFEAVTAFKVSLLDRAFERFRGRIGGHSGEAGFECFCSEEADWLKNHALFVSLKEHFRGAAWTEWPKDVRDREPGSLHIWRERLGDLVEREKFIQYIFFTQWRRLKRYCADRGIQILGDIPIYVSHDSADVWANRSFFKLDETGRPTFVAGVPPDYFSATGQLWGNPVYHWDSLRADRYAWWVRRFRHNLALFDMVRLDHFRGFVSYWEVPAGEQTAVNGHWEKVPVSDFMDTMMRRFPYLPLVAEDLGVITPEVREIMSEYGFPGMKVLLFAFGGDVGRNPYVPHRHTAESVVYTGTHDNNTARGWFRQEADAVTREGFFRYIGREVTEDDVPSEMIRLALASVAPMAVLSMQDVLGLGGETRMNTPAVTHGNWEWRLFPNQAHAGVAQWLLEGARLYGRA